MDPKLIRQRLGLPEDASDEQVESALSELRQLTGEDTPIGALPVQQHPGTGDRGNDTVAPPAPPASQTGNAGESVQNAPANDPNAAPIEDPGPPANAAIAVPEGMALIDQATLAELQQGARAGLALAAQARQTEIRTLVHAARDDGRIPPSRVAAWEQYLGTDYEGGKAALAALTPGLGVPLAEVGFTGSTEEGDTLGQVAYPSHWLPEVGRANARREALASGRVNDRLALRVSGEGVR